MTAPSMIPSKFLPKPNDLGVVAVGFSGGQCKPGVDAAPQALLEAGLLTQLKQDLNYTLHHDSIVHTYFSLIPSRDPDVRGMKNPRAVSAVTQQIAEQVYAHAREGRCVLTLGGDHSIAVGTIAGTSRAVREGKIGGGAGSGRGSGEIGVIWIDAHADINTPETSESGNIHGMPVAWLTGLAQRSGVETKGNGDALKSEGQEEEENEVFGWLDKTSQSQQARTNGVVNGISSDKQNGAASKPMLNLKKLVYIGLRDVDRAEKEILRKEGIKAFSMHDIDRHGIGRITDLALAHLGPNTPIHLSFDVDALDPQWAPSTGTPVRGGLTLREGDFIAECVHQTGQLVAMDLVEVNPRLQPGPGEEETVRAGVSLVRCALGDQLL